MNARRVLSALLMLFLSLPVSAGECVLSKLQDEIRGLARDAGPAVVKVTAERKGPLRMSGGFLSPGISVEALLNRSSTVGTGFLIDEKGLILTTDQLAGNSTSVQVKFSDGTIREGEVLGRDEFFKVALLKVEPVEGLEPLRLAPAGEVPLGSLGILMGNSFGISGNMSLGIVTGARRSAGAGDDYDNYLVLNAPILPGDAGGPFLDPEGRVLGMGVIPYSGAMRLIGGEGSGLRIGDAFVPTGMGCLVPATDLHFAIEEIKAHGRVREGRLGVLVNRGTLEVRQVLEGTAASEAGLEAGDVFLALADKALQSGADLFHVLRRTKVGRSVSVRVRRSGSDLGISIRLDLAPPRSANLLRMVEPDEDGTPVLQHVEIAFEELGFRVGDRILSVNGKKVANHLQLLKELVLKQASGPFQIVLQRGDEKVEITIPR